MTTTPQKGFTLIELAVVIAIIAILAAVAIPRFGDTTAQAERSMIKDMVSQLTSAASIYTAEQSTTPNNFGNYVGNGKTPNGNQTISLGNFGTKPGNCTVGGATITCGNTAFNKYNAVTYTYQGGVVTVTGTPTNGAPAL